MHGNEDLNGPSGLRGEGGQDTVPGSSVETIQLAGTPAQVHAWQYVDDAAILDVTAAPSDQDVAPNGSECGPTCRQASVAWTLN